jgi:hypothetical protein
MADRISTPKELRRLRHLPVLWWGRRRPVEAAAPARTWRPALITLAAVVALGGAMFGITWNELGRDRSIRGLPSGVRRDLYGRTLAEVRSVCTQPAVASGALREHCLEQARFLARFPECTADCQAAVSRALPPPARK